MLERTVAVSVVIAIALLAILLESTTPATMGPVGILIIFILMYVSVLGVLTFLLQLGSGLISKVGSFLAFKKPIEPLGFKKSYYYSTVIALAPILFIGMQSVGEISFYDIFLVVVFVSIACVYIAKRT